MSSIIRGSDNFDSSVKIEGGSDNFDSSVKIEEGENTYGNYIKYPDGTVIQNVIVNASGSIGSAAIVNITVYMPLALVSPENASVSYSQNASGHGFIIPSGGYCSSTQVTLFIGNTTGSTRAYSVSRATVIGKWK